MTVVVVVVVVIVVVGVVVVVVMVLFIVPHTCPVPQKVLSVAGGFTVSDGDVTQQTIAQIPERIQRLTVEQIDVLQTQELIMEVVKGCLRSFISERVVEQIVDTNLTVWSSDRIGVPVGV